MTDTKHPAGHVLQAYHDGELDPSAAAEVAAHCESCEACRAELAELERVSRVLAGAPAPELPRSVWQRVRPDRAAEARFRPGLAIAACAAGIALGVLLGPIPFGEETTETERAWTETATILGGDATASLLDVYQSGLE